MARVECVPLNSCERCITKAAEKSKKIVFFTLISQLPKAGFSFRFSVNNLVNKSK
jgi:hypothetical protein